MLGYYDVDIIEGFKLDTKVKSSFPQTHTTENVAIFVQQNLDALKTEMV